MWRQVCRPYLRSTELLLLCINSYPRSLLSHSVNGDERRSKIGSNGDAGFTSEDMDYITKTIIARYAPSRLERSGSRAIR